MEVFFLKYMELFCHVGFFGEDQGSTPEVHADSENFLRHRVAGPESVGG